MRRSHALDRMQVLPVLDLLNGVVMRGGAGRRSEYRPVVSHLVASAEPLAVAEAFRTHFGLNELYLADLDAIAGRELSLPAYRALLRLRVPPPGDARGVAPGTIRAGAG